MLALHAAVGDERRLWETVKAEWEAEAMAVAAATSNQLTVTVGDWTDKCSRLEAELASAKAAGLVAGTASGAVGAATGASGALRIGRPNMSPGRLL